VSQGWAASIEGVLFVHPPPCEIRRVWPLCVLQGGASICQKKRSRSLRLTNRRAVDPSEQCLQIGVLQSTRPRALALALAVRTTQ
jgi:hypothetical protein